MIHRYEGWFEHLFRDHTNMPRRVSPTCFNSVSFVSTLLDNRLLALASHCTYTLFIALVSLFRKLEVRMSVLSVHPGYDIFNKSLRPLPFG